MFFSIKVQERSQEEASKPGLQHHIGPDAKTLTLLLANNKSTGQPVHPDSLISAFAISYLKTRRSDIY